MRAPPSPPSPPFDPATVTAWVFDLDNTLYPASSSLFPQIDRRMRRFIADTLGLSLDDAFALQKRYYRDYGTTLRGLMTCHGLDPAAFLDFVHDIDHSVLTPDPALDAALERLPGRKLVFTNGSARHARGVLDRLGIARHFEAVFDIVAADYIPKPDPAPYDQVVARYRLDPAAAVMVEDIHRNLRPAARLGMTTVWVRQEDYPDATVNRQDEHDLSHVGHVIDNLGLWLDRVVPA